MSFHSTRILFPHPILGFVPTSLWEKFCQEPRPTDDMFGRQLGAVHSALKEFITYSIRIADSLHRNKLTNPPPSTTQYTTQLSYFSLINTPTRPINHNITSAMIKTCLFEIPRVPRSGFHSRSSFASKGFKKARGGQSNIRLSSPVGVPRKSRIFFPHGWVFVFRFCSYGRELIVD